MTHAQAIVMQLKQSLSSGDLAAARKLLRDDLSFQGPFDTFDRPEPYLEALRRLAGVVKSVEMKRVFADGDDVCLLYEMTADKVGTTFIAEWHHVRDGQIAAIRVVFDARPWAPLFAGKAG